MTDDAARHQTLSRWRWPLGLIAVGLVVGGLAGFVFQVEVTDDQVAATRPCGSAFDVVADRSGWETWWARDLDEPEPAIRSALIRTSECPGAVNQRLVIGAAMMILGVGLGAAAIVAGRRSGRGERDERDEARQVRMAGATVAVAGAVLTLAGLVALVILIADADSTLFLYTDRVVVALAGVIVLVPAIALVAGGWAIRAVGQTLAERDRP